MLKPKRSFSEDVPHLAIDVLPETERASAGTLWRQLFEFGNIVERFDVALALLDLSEQLIGGDRSAREAEAAEAAKVSALAEAMSVFGSKDEGWYPKRWAELAARAAAVAGWDFQETMQGVCRNLGESPTLRQMITDTDLYEIIEQFKHIFPNAKDLRHGAAHPSAGLNFFQKHATEHLDGNVTGIELRGVENVVVNALHGRTLLITFEKKCMQLDITEETLQTLCKFRKKTYDVFRPATEKMKQMWFEKYGLARSFPQ